MTRICIYLLSIGLLLSNLAVADSSSPSAAPALPPETAAAATVEHLSPFRAVYKAKYHGIKVNAVRELRQLPDGSYQLNFVADSWIAKITEASQFNWLTGADGKFQLQPLKYEYHREGLGRDRHAYLAFDWAQSVVTNDVQNKAWKMDIPLGTLDKLSYQLQMRQDLLQHTPLDGYEIADGGSLKQYDFELLGEEWLDTNVGKLKTLKVERIRENTEKRKTFIWFAPDADYLIVRLQHWEDGKGYELDLHEATLNGVVVRGQTPEAD